MWWAVATLTTVGYGDVVPVTGLGRVLAALTALTGVAVIAVPTGLIAAAFADAMRAARSHHHHRDGGPGDGGQGPGGGEGA
jgi:voltage-gated potassium channel